MKRLSGVFDRRDLAADSVSASSNSRLMEPEWLGGALSEYL